MPFTDAYNFADTASMNMAYSVEDALVADSVMRDTLIPLTPENIFGPYSFMPDVAETTYHPLILNASTGYQILVLVLLCAYLYIMMRYYREAGILIKSVFSGKRDNDRDEEHETTSPELTWGLLATGILMIGVVTVKAGYTWLPDSVVHDLPDYFGWAGVLAAAATYTILILIQQLVIYIAGALTFNKSFVRILLQRRRQAFMVMSIFATPAAILMALTSGGILVWLAIIISMIFVMFILGYVFQSFGFFVKQKVSILFWILYLCAVEIIPVVILVTGLFRNI